MAESSAPEIRGVLLFINLHKAKAPLLADEIIRILGKRGIRVDTFPAGKDTGFSVPGEYDVALSLGGDGMVLQAARTMAPRGVPIIPVNMGTLGFIAAVPPADWEPVFDRWLLGKAVISRRLMLELTVERRGREVLRGSCLNDLVISASGIAKLIRLRVESEYMQLGPCRSDGLIVATPTGSTAYSVAAGGPIMDPEMEALIVNPICPFTLSNRPVVVPAGDPLVVEVEGEQRSGVLLTVDGQLTEALEPGDRIRIRQAPCKALLVASGREMFYRALRSKLNWAGPEGNGDA